MNGIKEKIDRLKDLIKEKGIVTRDRQKIISPDGSKCAWLFDLRNIFLNAEGLSLIVDIFWDRFEKEYPFQIGGQEIAAIPLISTIVMKSQLIGKSASGFIVRKSRKPTGLQKIVEGDLTNEKIILVDDLINSGKTALRQIQILETFGKKVDFYFTLINFRGDDNIKLLAEKNVNLISLFSLKDFGLSLNEKKIELPSEKFGVVWQFQPPDPSYFYIVPKSTPCLDQEKIYFGSDGGYLWSLRQKDGSVAWKFKVGHPVRGKSIFSSPAVYRNKVFFGSYDGNVYALDKETGKLRWKFWESDWVGSSPAIAPDLGLLFIGLEFGIISKRGGIVALDLDTGKDVWDFRMKEYVHCSPAYCPSKKVVAIGGNDRIVYMFNAKNGKLLWKFETNGEIKASLAFDPERNLVLFGSFDQNMYALDIDTGEEKMKFETQDYIYSTPKIHENNVYFTSTDKNLYSLNLDSGKLNWRFEAGGRIFSTPEIIDNKVFFGATDGKFYEIDASSGKFISCLQFTERITGKVAYNSVTEKYFVSTYANEIYCLERKYANESHAGKL